MTTRRMLNELKKLLPEDQLTPVLSAFKNNPVFWKALQDESLPERVDSQWNFTTMSFSPASLALFLVDADLISGNYPQCSPTAQLLEQAMLRYEEALFGDEKASTLEEAAVLAIALTEKHKIDQSWGQLFAEITEKGKYTSAETLISDWASVLSLVCGWIDEKGELIQAILSAKSPSFGFAVVKNILFSLPLSENEIVSLFKHALLNLGLDQQIAALQTLRYAGKDSLVKQVAGSLTDRYLISSTDSRSVSEIWQSSEKSLNSSVYTRELAALAQLADDPETAEKLLKQAERILAAELAGVKIQQFSLHTELGQSATSEEIKSARAIIEDDQVRTELQSALGESNAEAKSLLDQLESLEDADSIDLNTKGIRALNWTPRTALQKAIALQDWQSAAQLVDALLRDAPADVELLAQKAEISRQSGDQVHYLADLEEVAQFERENGQVKEELARGYEKQGDWQAAFTHYDDLVNHFMSEETDDLLGYAQSAVETDQPALAVESTSKALLQQPENGRALAIQGYAEYRLGQSEQALEHLGKAVEIAPELAEPWKMLAKVQKEKGEIAQSIDTLRTARSAVPADAEIVRALAAELIAQGQAAEALSVLNSEEANSATDLQASLLKIAAMRQLNLPDADAMIEKTYQAFSSQTEAVHEYADLMLRRGETDQARKLIEPLALSAGAKIDWKLTYADSVLGQDYRRILGQPLLEKSDRQKAVQVLSEVLEREPENVYANILAGEMALKEGEAEKAFNLFSNLLNNGEAQGTNWLSRIQAGFAWAANLLGKFNYALAGIQSVLEANPNWAGARETLAEVSANSGEIEEAVTQANQVLESAANVAESVQWFADFMGNLGKTDEAAHAISALAKSHSQKLPLLLKLAEIQVNQGQTEEAKTTLESCKQMLAKSKLDDELLRGAKLFQQAGDEAMAYESLKLRTLLPETASQNTLVDLAGYQRINGENESALTTIQAAEQKFGAQAWLKLLEAELQHALGENETALATMSEVGEENAFLPAIEELNYLPSAWKSLLVKEANAAQLAASLAFETGDYALAGEKVAAMEPSAARKVLRVEIGHALGDATETIPFMDLTPDQPFIYVEPEYAAEVIETLLDAGQQEKAAEIIHKAVEIFPDDLALALGEARYLAESGSLNNAEVLLDQAIAKFALGGAIISAADTLVTRNLIKAAVAANRWEEAKTWSNKLLTSQPKSLAAIKIALEVLVLAIEFGKMIAGLRVKKHLQTDENALSAMKSSLRELVISAESLNVKEFDHLIARAQMALGPSQTSIRAMAMNAPQKGDVVAMMVALKESGQATTAVQLAKKQLPAADVFFATAYCLQETNPGEAVFALKQSLKKNAAQPWASTMAAMLEQKSGDATIATNDLSEALEFWPDEPEWQILAADLARSNGNQKEAVAHYEAAAELDAENLAYKFLLGKAWLQSGEGAKAIEILAPLSKEEVNNYEVWETLAEAYFEQGDSENALNAAERASAVNDFSASPLLLSAKIHLAQGNFKKALEVSQKASVQDGENAEAQILLAKSWLANGDKVQALQALEKAVKVKTPSLEVMVEHAKLMKEINGAANARPLFEALAQKYPENTDLLNLLAEAQLAAGDKLAAETNAQRSLKLNEAQPKMQQFLGKLELDGGHLDQAIFHYSQAIAQAPQTVEVYLDLSNAYQQQREYDEALKTLQHAMDLAPSDTRPLLAAVNLMRNAKDYPNAENLLRKAAEIAPSDLNIRRQLGAVIALNMVHSSQEASSHV